MRVNQCAGPGCRILGVAEREMDQVLLRDDDEYKRHTAWVAQPLRQPVPYLHRKSQLVWVSLDPGVTATVEQLTV